MEIRDLLTEVESEIIRATAKHGPMKGGHEAYAVILEELDEFWEEVKLNPTKMTADQRDAWQNRMYKELIQVSAMALRAILDVVPNDLTPEACMQAPSPSSSE